MKILKILIIAFIIIYAESAVAQWAIMKQDADSIVKLGSDYIYDCQFDKAEKCFEKVEALYPDHPAGYFLDAMVEWWKITLYRGSEKYNEAFLKKIDKVIDLTDKLLKENKYNINALFFKAGALGYRARYYVLDESWVSAAKDGAEAYDLMLECYKIAPGNHDIMLGTGIYNYFAAAIPEKYSIVKPLIAFIPRGDKQVGLLQLKASASLARYSAIEAKVVLLQIYTSFENNPYEALAIADELTKKYPNNPYFERAIGRAYVRLGYLDNWENTWRSILIKCFDKKFGYDPLTAREAMYYIGMALMDRNDYENALKYFYKCDEGSRKLDKSTPSGFMVYTNLRIGKIYDLQNKREYAVKQYKKVLNMKNYDNTHNEAEKYLKTPYGK